MTHPVEFAVFAFFTVTVIGLGLALSFKRIGRLTIEEMFLGSRTLRMIPLALSALASVMSSTGIIAFSAHFYAYGLHVGWTASVATLLLIPFTVHVDVPVLYRLKITSVFEYLRARYCNKISLTACIMHFILTQSTGAISICAAAMAMSTIFHFPFFWSCLAIGLTGTVYTTVGGLRGVVWTDCMQALVTIFVPITLFIKTMYDSQSDVFKPRTLSDFDVGTYALDTTLDFTKDENIWSCLIGALSLHIYRSGMDQMVVQRYMASRSLEDAKWTAGVGMTLFSLSYVSLTGMGILLIYWFRDCDPLLSGSIKQLDQNDSTEVQKRRRKAIWSQVTRLVNDVEALLQSAQPNSEDLELLTERLVDEPLISEKDGDLKFTHVLEYADKIVT
ncbi:sodium-coupled monocarboxylate transporter 2-like [Ixodes scapularis]